MVPQTLVWEPAHPLMILIDPVGSSLHATAVYITKKLEDHVTKKNRADMLFEENLIPPENDISYAVSPTNEKMC